MEKNNLVSDYLQENQYRASILVNVSTYEENNYFEVINNEVSSFESLENILNLNKENKHICVVNDGNYDICLEHKNYLVEPTLTLDSTNYIDVKNELDSGCIIFITSKARLSDVKLLLKEIKYKNYDVVFLSDLISEENV